MPLRLLLLSLLATGTSDAHPPLAAFKISDMSAQTLHTRSASISSSSTGSFKPRQPTDAFRGLVAFFPRGTHSTAIYTWSASCCRIHDASEQHVLRMTMLSTSCAASNKGILASLGGVESGDFPIDVIFSRAGDPFLSRCICRLCWRCFRSMLSYRDSL